MENLSENPSKMAASVPMLTVFTNVMRDFLTLTKPGVLSLVLFTGYVGLILAPFKIGFLQACLSLIAIALGSGGAGAINMWYDHDIDLIMKRTQNRPIPCGRISPKTGLMFGLILSFSSVILMLISANVKAAGLLAFSIFFYVIIYTVWLKRRTPQNIVIGGAAGAFPPVIGWMATGSPLTLEPYLLFLIIFLWTPPHFWALALNKSQDYERAKVPMMPNVAGVFKTRQQIFYYTLALVISAWMPWFAHIRGHLYSVIATVLGSIFFYYALKIFQKGDQRDCTRLFLFSILYLFILFFGMLLDYYLGDL